MTRFLPKTLTRTAVVTAISASLALSPVAATPAKAGDEQVGAIAAASFLALLTAGIIASTAKNRDNGFVFAPLNQRPNRGDHGPRRGNARKLLPEQCEFVVRRGPDRGTYFGKRCLKRHFDHWTRLPERCEERVWMPRRDRNVNAFDAKCLGRLGYRTADARRR